MMLKYNDFYTLMGMLNNMSLKNKKFSNKLFLFYYFNLFYKYNMVSLEMLSNTKNSLAVNMHMLNYLYKFYNLYMEMLLIKYTTKKYYKMYIYMNFFNFFFKFLNWYYNFLFFNTNIFVLDSKVLKVLDYNIFNKNFQVFMNIIHNYNCKFFMNLDNKMSKDFLKLFYEFDLYVLDLSTVVDYKYNKNNLLQLFFFVSNLVLFTKFFNNM